MVSTVLYVQSDLINHSELNFGQPLPNEVFRIYETHDVFIEVAVVVDVAYDQRRLLLTRDVCRPVHEHGQDIGDGFEDFLQKINETLYI